MCGCGTVPVIQPGTEGPLPSQQLHHSWLCHTAQFLMHPSWLVFLDYLEEEQYSPSPIGVICGDCVQLMQPLGCSVRALTDGSVAVSAVVGDVPPGQSWHINPLVPILQHFFSLKQADMCWWKPTTTPWVLTTTDKAVSALSPWWSWQTICGNRPWSTYQRWRLSRFKVWRTGELTPCLGAAPCQTSESSIPQWWSRFGCSSGSLGKNKCVKLEYWDIPKQKMAARWCIYPLVSNKLKKRRNPDLALA